MTREDVIRQIVERDIQKKGISEEAVRREAPELLAGACEFFGTWKTALEYAGISKQRIRTSTRQKSKSSKRTMINSESGPEPVIKEIRRLCLTGYELSAKNNLRRDRRLYDAARRNFGSWRQALVAAGINLEHVRVPSKPRKFNRDELIAQLRHRHESGQTVIWHQVCFENRAFSTAIKTAFGSWRQGLVAAGLSERLRQSRGQRWDWHRVVGAIQRRRREGKSLQCSRVRTEQAGLVSAARRFYATWDEAVKAAVAHSLTTLE